MVLKRCVLYRAGGIEVLCESLVKSSKQVINTAPSLVSTMMHNLGGSGKVNKKIDAETNDQLTNFAPLGIILFCF